LKPEHIAVLHDIVTGRAQGSLQEIADELHHRSGVRVCDATIRRALRAQGIVRLKPLRRACAARAEGAKRYGYTAAHRRENVEPYSTNLTDAEWDLVADLFERVPGQRGTPAHYSRRDLVNACSYILRTGCAWRLLTVLRCPGLQARLRWAIPARKAIEADTDRLRLYGGAHAGAVSAQCIPRLPNNGIVKTS
jgi:putative transposase